MFFTCCGRRSRGKAENWSESQKTQGPPDSSAQPNHQTAAQMMNSSDDFQTPPNIQRLRTISSSSFGSLKSIQSFYSAKSGEDEDFYSVCSDGSSRERY